LKEYLNGAQIDELKKRHPDANKTNFMERVSKVTITKQTDWSLLRKFHDYGVDATVIMGKR